MRTLKIAGAVALGLWMAFMTWRIERIANMSETACAWAYAAGNPPKPGQDQQVFCPLYRESYVPGRIGAPNSN